MAIGVQGQRLGYPQSPFPTTIGNPPSPQIGGTNVFSLKAAQRTIIPAGLWMVSSTNAVVQYKDPVSGIWYPLDQYSGSPFTVNSDGVNFCVFNPTASLVAAIVTTGGVGYVAGSPPAVTISSGGGTAVAVVGGAIGTISFVTNQTSVTSGVGNGFTYPPLVSIAAPASGGVQASAVAVLGTDTRISKFVITNQGAGYAGTNVPVQIVPNPDDPTLGSVINATAQAVTTGGGAVTAVLITNNGLGTLTGPPTITIAAPTAGTQAVAVGLPALSAVGFTQSIGGSGFGGTGALGLVFPAPLNLTPEFTNPRIQGSFYTPRMAQIFAKTSGSGLGGLTPEGATVIDGGLLTSSSSVIGFVGFALSPGAVIPPTATAVTFGSTPATVTMTLLGGSA